MALLEDPTRAPEQVVLPTRLVVRQSCRPVGPDSEA
jgi:DNA-binding LacI/PurR family transcriptional regulator